MIALLAKHTAPLLTQRPGTTVSLTHAMYPTCRPNCTAVDIDALVVGVWWGEHKHSGKFGEFLLALARRPHDGSRLPKQWVTFCKVTKAALS